jgi:hypothetical protein
MYSLQVTIDAAQLDHEGTYTCLAVNKAGTLDIDVQLVVLGLLFYVVLFYKYFVYFYKRLKSITLS